ncbi:hypothetical protein ACKKBF_B09685 [Auxenochlorella protothecoides x Auxenochlorella symbiontica]
MFGFVSALNSALQPVRPNSVPSGPWAPRASHKQPTTVTRWPWLGGELTRLQDEYSRLQILYAGLATGRRADPRPHRLLTTVRWSRHISKAQRVRPRSALLHPCQKPLPHPSARARSGAAGQSQAGRHHAPAKRPEWNDQVVSKPATEKTAGFLRAGSRNARVALPKSGPGQPAHGQQGSAKVASATARLMAASRARMLRSSAGGQAGASWAVTVVTGPGEVYTPTPRQGPDPASRSAGEGGWAAGSSSPRQPQTRAARLQAQAWGELGGMSLCEFMQPVAKV